MNIRHINRGDIPEGGCGLCKPRHSRKDEIIPVLFDADERLQEYFATLAEQMTTDEELFGPPDLGDLR